MKKHHTKYYIIFLLLLSSNFSFSQNWRPLRQGWKYNFKLDGSDIITNTFWIDSSHVFGSDSVFYLNRIAVHCDTCTATLGGQNPCDTCYGLKNQPQFLQRKFSKLPNGIYFFNDTSKFILKSLAVLNDTWLFDSVANINATIISISQNLIFGNNDSVKTILLSSGDTICFSKNYGILQFPNLYGLNSYYHLAGIQGPNLGEQVPNFWQIFDFHVGDVFHYQGSYFDGSALPPLSIYYDKQYTINAVSVFNDSLSYSFQGSTWGVNLGVGSFNSPIGGTIWLYDSLEHFANSNSQKFLNINTRTVGNFGEYLFYPDSVYDFVHFTLDSNGIFTKSFGIDNNFYNCSYTIVDSSDLLNSINPNTNWTLWCSSLTYKSGLGQTDYSYGFFEHGGYEHLVGYVKNGDTVGVVSGIKQVIDINPFFTLNPNPASDIINLHFFETGAIKVFLSDVTGKKIFEKNFNSPNIQIDVKPFSSGIYFLSVESKNLNITRKVFILKE